MFSIGHLIQILYITQIILILDNAYECLKYPLVSGENIYRYTFSTKGWVPLRTARISKLQVVESGVRGKMPLEPVCVWV